jgi:hypothetical protein
VDFKILPSRPTSLSADRIADLLISLPVSMVIKLLSQFDFSGSLIAAATS